MRGESQNRRWQVADIVFIAVIAVFFAVCVAYVRGLDRLVRATEEVELKHMEAEQ